MDTVDAWPAIAQSKMALVLPIIFRIQPLAEQPDSGWHFVHGTEDEAYMDNPQNFKIYDVNTIANYRPEIVPLLDEPVGSAFYWNGTSFVADPLGPPRDLDGPLH